MTFTDDIGTEWNATLDPPAVLTAAVARSVSRWKTNRFSSTLPAARPNGCDVAINHASKLADSTHYTAKGVATFLYDAGASFGPLLRSTKAAVAANPLWEQ